jgi:hypothetical protein
MVLVRNCIDSTPWIQIRIPETKTVPTDLIHVREVRIRSVYYVLVLYMALLIFPHITIPPHYTAASKTRVHKITDVPVFYMELLKPGISGLKKASIFSAHPFQNGPRN